MDPGTGRRSTAGGSGMELLSRLAERLPNGLRLRSSDAIDRTGDLYASELRTITGAVESRRREFSSVRWLARQGLAEIGVAAQPIPPGPDRAPVWPAGVVGSMTHSRSVCGAVVGSAEQYEGVGIDLELSEVDVRDLGDMILSTSERQENLSEERLRLIFSAKESVYKCIYPIHRIFLDFHDLEIVINAADETFSARSQSPKAPPEKLIHGIGLFEIGDPGVSTLFTVPR
jgi:4'-phosphopantetheinyl transferase EntD